MASHLVVVAHPVEQSLTMGLARAYTQELAFLGNTCRTYDLYRIGFDPLLSAAELATGEHPASADVRHAQEALRAADVLTVIYPLWWLTMPAILKGYIDRVFARGFAYEAQEGIVKGLLTGKRCVIVTLSGAPLSTLVEDGRWGALEALQDIHIFRAAGFELLEHLHFDRIEPHLPAGDVERHITRIRTLARRHFS